MIYLKDNTIYFKIKKNMSSAIVNAMTKQGDWKVITELPPKYKFFWKWTVLREPIDRFVSGYITVVKRDLPWREMAWDTEEVMWQFLNRLKQRGASINDHKNCLNYHVATQLSFLPCKMDYCVIQEQLPESWEEIFAMTDLDIPEPENVRDKETKDKVYTLLSSRNLKLIKKIYKKDIKFYDKHKTGK